HHASCLSQRGAEGVPLLTISAAGGAPSSPGAKTAGNCDSLRPREQTLAGRSRAGRAWPSQLSLLAPRSRAVRARRAPVPGGFGPAAADGSLAVREPAVREPRPALRARRVLVLRRRAGRRG